MKNTLEIGDVVIRILDTWRGLAPGVFATVVKKHDGCYDLRLDNGTISQGNSSAKLTLIGNKRDIKTKGYRL